MPVRRFVNPSPLVFLVREDLLEILRAGVDEVAVPELVIEEIRGHGMDDPTVQALDRVSWLTILPGPSIPPPIAAWRLGPGESAVLALALAEEGSWAVVDDWGARRCARSLAIPVIGTLGLVLLARQAGLIPAARPVVERLRRSGMYLSDEIIREALARVGE
jgi:predicted nucleic acid-binding protein